MFVLFLLHTAAALNITQFPQYEISFEANCSEYLLYQGPRDSVYMYFNENQTEAWITQNASYAIYVADHRTFRWNNGIENMDKVLGDGVITYPLEFDDEFYMCPIVSASIGYDAPCTSCLSYKCKQPIWIYPMLVIGLAFTITVLLYGSISDPQVSRIVEWGGEIYTRIREARERSAQLS